MKPECEAICAKWDRENIPRNGAIRGAVSEAYELGRLELPVSCQLYHERTGETLYQWPAGYQSTREEILAKCQEIIDKKHLNN